MHIFYYRYRDSTATGSASSLYHFSGQLLSFATIARTPEQERRQMKRREEDMADRVAAVLAQVEVLTFLFSYAVCIYI